MADRQGGPIKPVFNEPSPGTFTRNFVNNFKKFGNPGLFGDQGPEIKDQDPLEIKLWTKIIINIIIKFSERRLFVKNV